jgi:acetyl-CoA carboxylase biotin carboxyl carrier protein
MNLFKEFKENFMELNVIKKLIELLRENNLKKIHLREGDFEIFLEKDEIDQTIKKEVKNPVEKTKSEEEKPVISEKNTSSKDFVLSPMVGTFYSASSPDEPPFVKIGDEVHEETVLCIIEAMKVMNEIKAGKKGIVKEILIENGQPVEFGSKLFCIKS